VRKNFPHTVADFSLRGKTSRTLWRIFPHAENFLHGAGSSLAFNST
jgi:hypothetical protein